VRVATCHRHEDQPQPIRLALLQAAERHADVGHLSAKLQERLWFPAPAAPPARTDSTARR
jgi:hypothetical protein